MHVFSRVANKQTHCKPFQRLLLVGWGFEQDIIDYMAWQVDHNGMASSAVARSLNKRGITGNRGRKWQGNSIT